MHQMFRLQHLCFGLLFTFTANLLPIHAQDSQDTEFQIGAYLPDYRFSITLRDHLPYLTDLFLFSFAPPLGECCLQQEEHWNKINEQILNNSTRVWLTVGGGGRSDFDAIEEPTPRFVKRLARLLEQQAVYQKTTMGVVFDHEAIRDQKDLNKFYTFLRSSSMRLKVSGFQVAVAVHAGMRFRNPNPDFVDNIHLMAYDMVADKKFHASMDDVKKAVEILQQDWEPSKIILGIPAYARHKDRPDKVITFAEVVDKGGSMESGDMDGYLYETPESVREKVRFAREQGLGGVFLWELGQDNPSIKDGPGMLVHAMYDEAFPNGRHDQRILEREKKQPQDNEL